MPGWLAGWLAQLGCLAGWLAACLAGSLARADSEIVMVDLGFGDDFFEQNRSWDDFGTTISGI